MAKPLDPKKIESARQYSSRAERREQRRKLMQDEIAENQRSNGVIVIPPKSCRKCSKSAPNCVLRRTAASAHRKKNRLAVLICRSGILPSGLKEIPTGSWWKSIRTRGISATTVKKAPWFSKMIADAVDGKIDLILTKSISRFGRNIVDILDNLNVLSALTPPVSVEFETEHITYTGDGKNNLLIVLLSALAEMESQQKKRGHQSGDSLANGRGNL